MRVSVYRRPAGKFRDRRLRAAMDAVNQFYVDNTDELWLSTTVTPLLTLPQVKAWYATAAASLLLTPGDSTEGRL